MKAYRIPLKGCRKTMPFPPFPRISCSRICLMAGRCLKQPSRIVISYTHITTKSIALSSSLPFLTPLSTYILFYLYLFSLSLPCFSSLSPLSLSHLSKVDGISMPPSLYAIWKLNLPTTLQVVLIIWLVKNHDILVNTTTGVRQH